MYTHEYNYIHTKEANMKSCTVCNETKELDQFDKRTKANGDKVPTGRCKACRRKYIREYSSKKLSKTGLTREEWLNKVRKPKLSPEERQEAGKAKWDAWYAENKDIMKEEWRKKAKQEREAIYAKGVKTCSDCDEELPVSAFPMRKRKRTDGSSYMHLHSMCKTCKNNKAAVQRATPEGKATAKAYRQSPAGKARAKRDRDLRKKRNRQATPKWLSKEHKQQIFDTYELMRDCRAVTGEDYHVDHIVPLRGENICGLHVPWNLQVLPGYVNISKSNN